MISIVKAPFLTPKQKMATVLMSYAALGAVDRSQYFCIICNILLHYAAEHYDLPRRKRGAVALPGAGKLGGPTLTAQEGADPHVWPLYQPLQLARAEGAL